MSVLPIRIFGDPVLRQRAHEVTVFDDALRRLADDMLDTMRDAAGAGLAANQVGVLRRLFTYQWADPSLKQRSGSDNSTEQEQQGQPGALVNPEVVETSQEIQESEEGCLSFPGLYYPTPRPLRARIRGQDVDGEPVELVGEDMLARIFLHEIDHLNGILFIDHLALHDRKEAMRRIRQGELEHPVQRPVEAVDPAAHAHDSAL